MSINIIRNPKNLTTKKGSYAKFTVIAEHEGDSADTMEFYWEKQPMDNPDSYRPVRDTTVPSGMVFVVVDPIKIDDRTWQSSLVIRNLDPTALGTYRAKITHQKQSGNPDSETSGSATLTFAHWKKVLRYWQRFNVDELLPAPKTGRYYFQYDTKDSYYISYDAEADDVQSSLYGIKKYLYKDRVPGIEVTGEYPEFQIEFINYNGEQPISHKLVGMQDDEKMLTPLTAISTFQTQIGRATASGQIGQNEIQAVRFSPGFLFRYNDGTGDKTALEPVPIEANSAYLKGALASLGAKNHKVRIEKQDPLTFEVTFGTENEALHIVKDELLYPGISVTADNHKQLCTIEITRKQDFDTENRNLSLTVQLEQDPENRHTPFHTIEHLSSNEFLILSSILESGRVYFDPKRKILTSAAKIQ